MKIKINKKLASLNQSKFAKSQSAARNCERRAFIELCKKVSRENQERYNRRDDMKQKIKESETSRD